MIPQYERGYLSTSDGARVPYLIVGSGPVPLVLIPGAGDGLRSVYDWAAPTAWALRARAQRFCTLVVSRREPLPTGFTAEQQAGDVISVIEALGWGPVILECNSGGGPIGQWMAVKRPELFKGLILASTLHRAPASTQAILRYWARLARQQDWAQLNWSSIEYSFRPDRVARYRLLRPLLALMPPPKDPERMVSMFESLIDVDTTAILPRIAVPTLVIGGVEDRLLGPAVQREMAELIPDSRLLLYPSFGHYNDQENPDYLRQVDRFVGQVWPERAQRMPGAAEKPSRPSGVTGLARDAAIGGVSGLLATAPMTLVMSLGFQRLPHHERDPLPPSDITANLQRAAGTNGLAPGQPEHGWLTLLAHFGYGSGAGAVYAPLARGVPGPALVKGIGFGLLVWLLNYLGVLPALRLFPPATQEPARRNALMVSAHVVWGAVLGVLVQRFGCPRLN